MDELQKWAEDFEHKLEELCDQPMREVFLDHAFWNWRLSYGIKTTEPSKVYFLAVYPAFCLTPKFTWHYGHLSDLALDVLEIEHFVADIPKWTEVMVHDRRLSMPDVVAVLFAILRDKESIELFQDQKDLMDLGLKHFHLDNYYQDFIRDLCQEYYSKGTFLGCPLHLNILKKKQGIGDGK
jgi:hypothetical protein